MTEEKIRLQRSLPRNRSRRLPEVKAAEDAQRLTRDNIRRVPLKAMNAANYNPRQITDEALEGLKFSLERWGLVENLVWNERTGNLIAGHQRYRVLSEAGQTEAATCVLDIDEEEEKLLNVALNNPAIQGTFDNKQLADLMKMLKFAKSPDVYKRSGLAALEKQLSLFDAPKPPVSVPSEPPKETEKGKRGAKAGATAGAPASGAVTSEPKPDVRVVQIFLNSSQHAEFMKGIQELCAALHLENISDTVFKLVQLAAAKLTPPAPSEVKE